MKCGIEYFRGSSNDVLARLMGAADKFGVDYFAIHSGDNLFCDPHLMEVGLNQMIKNKLDFLTIPDSLVCGGAAYCISTEALKRVCKLKKDTDTEYYPKYFTSGKKFNVQALKTNDRIFFNTNVRLTLDYSEDLKFARKIFNELGTNINSVPLKKILQLLEKNKELALINFFRQKDWEKNQKPMRI